MFEGLRTIVRERSIVANPNRQQFERSRNQLHLLGISGQTWGTANSIFAANPTEETRGTPPFLLSLEAEVHRAEERAKTVRGQIQNLTQELNEADSNVNSAEARLATTARVVDDYNLNAADLRQWCDEQMPGIVSRLQLFETALVVDFIACEATFVDGGHVPDRYWPLRPQFSEFRCAVPPVRVLFPLSYGTSTFGQSRYGVTSLPLVWPMISSSVPLTYPRIFHPHCQHDATICTGGFAAMWEYREQMVSSHPNGAVLGGFTMMGWTKEAIITMRQWRQNWTLNIIRQYQEVVKNNADLLICAPDLFNPAEGLDGVVYPTYGDMVNATPRGTTARAVWSMITGDTLRLDNEMRCDTCNMFDCICCGECEMAQCVCPALCDTCNGFSIPRNDFGVFICWPCASKDQLVSLIMLLAGAPHQCTFHLNGYFRDVESRQIHQCTCMCQPCRNLRFIRQYLDREERIPHETIFHTEGVRPSRSVDPAVGTGIEWMGGSSVREDRTDSPVRSRGPTSDDGDRLEPPTSGLSVI